MTDKQSKALRATWEAAVIIDDFKAGATSAAPAGPVGDNMRRCFQGSSSDERLALIFRSFLRSTSRVHPHLPGRVSSGSRGVHRSG